jgi:hypothetical protein
MIYLIHCKNLFTCHNIPPSSIPIKEKISLKLGKDMDIQLVGTIRTSTGYDQKTLHPYDITVKLPRIQNS